QAPSADEGGSPSMTTRWVSTAMQHLSAGDLAAAEQALIRAREQEPLNAEVLRALVQTRLSLNNPRGAIASARQLLRLVPTDLDAQSDLALARLGTGDRKALAVLQALTELPGSTARTWNNLGLGLVSKGRVEEAKPAFLKAIAL